MKPHLAQKKISVNQEIYNRLVYYARKDDRTTISSLVRKIFDSFLAKYSSESPCSNCGKNMQEELSGYNVNTYPVLEFDMARDVWMSMENLAKSAKVEVGIIVNSAVRNYLKRREEAANKLTCLHCGSKEYEVRNHDPRWGDGEIHCKNCGTYFRDFDSG